LKEILNKEQKKNGKWSVKIIEVTPWCKGDNGCLSADQYGHHHLWNPAADGHFH
jgi:hypothetical protein